MRNESSERQQQVAVRQVGSVGRQEWLRYHLSALPQPPGEHERDERHAGQAEDIDQRDRLARQPERMSAIDGADPEHGVPGEGRCSTATPAPVKVAGPCW